MPDQQAREAADQNSDNKLGAQALNDLQRLPGRTRGGGRMSLRLTHDHLSPQHPAVRIDPATGHVLIDPDMPPLAPRYRAYIPIARFLADVLAQKPNARVRISVTGANKVVAVPAGITIGQLKRLVDGLIPRTLKTDPDARAGIHGNSGGQPVSLSVAIDGPGFPPASGTLTAPVTVYLSDEAAHEEVEAAVEALIARAGLQVEARDEPVLGSWFRKMHAGVRTLAGSPAGREAALTVAHAADSRLVLAQDAYVTATLLQNLGPVIQSLQPTRDAVLRIGALLIVKVDWAVQVFQLTAAQQALLDHQPQLATKPDQIIAALQLSASEVDPLQSLSETESPLTER